MAEPKLVFAGLAKSAAEGVIRPFPVLDISISEITTETNGKIFASVQVIEPGEVVMGMAVDGSPVDILRHDEAQHTTVEVTQEGRYKSFSLWLPGGMLKEDQIFPADHIISLYWGLPGQIAHGWKEGNNFILRLTGLAPNVSYNPLYDSSSDVDTDSDGNSA